jgi:hypothetical protein
MFHYQNLKKTQKKNCWKDKEERKRFWLVTL